MRRFGLVVLVLLLASTGTNAHKPDHSRHPYGHGLVNGMRISHNRVIVSFYQSLMSQAQRHAERMARRGDIWHSGCDCWEAVGYGPSIRSIFRAFWGSAGHRRVLLCPCRYIGFGIARRGGTVYVAVQAR